MEKQGKFITQGYKDVPWAIIYLLHLVAIIAFGIYAAKTTNWSHVNHFDPRHPEDNHLSSLPGSLRNVCVVIVSSLALGLLAGIVLLLVLKAMAKQFIWISNILQIVLAGVGALIGFAAGIPILGIVMLILFFFNALWLYLVRDRIAFASVVLSAACEVIFRYLATVAVALLGVLLNVVYICLWAMAAYRAWDESVILRIVLILVLYWAVQVWQNTVHVTISGTVATWYFLSHSPPPNPTLGALKRSLTTSFGSICLGSLVVAIIQTLRTIAQSLRQNDNGFVACCMECLLSWLESLVEYFNLYAYTQVAIYGKSYIQAARDTWALIKHCGMTAIINDSLIGNALMLSALIFGVVGGLVAACVPNDFDNYAFYAVIGCVIAFAIVAVFTTIVTSAIVTIFVCYAEEPQALQMSNPDLAHRLHEAISDCEGATLDGPAATAPYQQPQGQPYAQPYQQPGYQQQQPGYQQPGYQPGYQGYK